MQMHPALIACLALFCAAGQSTAAPILGQADDFQDGTNQGWGDGQSNFTTVPTNLTNAGPTGAGDNALDVAFNARAVVLNRDTRWIGDYTAAGVTAIQVDVNNTSNSDANLRLGVTGPGGAAAGGSGDTWVTDSQLVSAGSGWVTLTFDLTAADLNRGSGTTGTAAGALAGVAELRLLDNASEDFKGVFSTGGFVMDNITAVPEPGSLGLLALGGMALIRRRR